VGYDDARVLKMQFILPQKLRERESCASPNLVSVISIYGGFFVLNSVSFLNNELYSGDSFEIKITKHEKSILRLSPNNVVV